MPDVVIENPVLNSAFEEPRRHFKFSDDGITDETVHERRSSAYFIPIPPPKKRGRQLAFNTEWTKDRIQENDLVNRVRSRVSVWRKGNYQGVTRTTRRLLDYWHEPERERKLFFCQIEAMETVIYITEVANRYGDSWIENRLREANADANPLLSRLALKMATGSGKTVVMAMLIAWQALNKLANRQDPRFSDTFFIATPGITIRDRLRVLLPNDLNSYYRKFDIIPSELVQQLDQAKIIITNFQAFNLRDKHEGARLTKHIATGGQETEAFKETPDQMVRRVCRELGNKKNIVVINDEAHHCYRRRAGVDDVKLTGDERREAEDREKAARIWITGLEAVKAKIGVKAVYDLSATPFFLRGSGYSEGTLFPWVVSDFSLIDAIECGVVKVPRVPVADDRMTGEAPTYRNLWLNIRDDLPKKGRGTERLEGQPNLPVELQGALHSLYGNYQKQYQQWESQGQGTPPVFIVVCNNTNVSKLVYDYVSGWEKPLPGGGTVVVPGALSIFNNEENGQWQVRPNTLLIDSEQLESGEGMSGEFKKMASREIEEFKAEYRARFPGRDAESLTDEDLLREVMNTVGKPGRLGEDIKCVVSVSMLSEGWDANTVTHILGVRAFGTQLLCEQVVGRGLRRINYEPNAKGMFEPEYAEVYGVPFSFIPCSGSTNDPKPGPTPTRVRALPERIAQEITYPRLAGYKYEVLGEELSAEFTDDARISLSTADIPTRTENAPIVGESVIHDLDDLKRRRPQEVAFLLAKLVLEQYFKDDDGNLKPWLFPQVLSITENWLDSCVTCKDNTFPQLLLLIEFAHDAAGRIYRAIVESTKGDKYLKPILRPYDTIGSTRYVDFDTTKPTYSTKRDRCHVSHVVADTQSWEQKLAQSLEDMDEVFSYVKNQGLGFAIPYTFNGQASNYVPDFLVCVRDGSGEDMTLIIEVTGERRRDKEAKVSTARNLWIPAVNNHRGFGRWGFLEIQDPWNAQSLIRALLRQDDAALLEVS